MWLKSKQPMDSKEPMPHFLSRHFRRTAYKDLLYAQWTGKLKWQSNAPFEWCFQYKDNICVDYYAEYIAKNP